MKKIVSFILTLAMVLGVFSIPVAAETQEQAFDTAETFAFALNITDRESYQPGKLITRAEFADLVYRLLNFANISSDDNSWYNENYGEDTKDELLVLGDTKIFEDVDKAVPQYDAIKYVSDNGLMNGMTPEIFGPSYDITTASVAKVMVNILGYEEVAQNKGGYPNGYMIVASSLKLLSGISAGKCYCNPIVNIDEDIADEDALPALTVYVKRDTNVETERVTLKRLTNISADKLYTVALTNLSKVVLAYFKK